jgi:hypothetical protein
MGTRSISGWGFRFDGVTRCRLVSVPFPRWSWYASPVGAAGLFYAVDVRNSMPRLRNDDFLVALHAREFGRSAPSQRWWNHVVPDEHRRYSRSDLVGLVRSTVARRMVLGSIDRRILHRHGNCRDRVADSSSGRKVELLKNGSVLRQARKDSLCPPISSLQVRSGFSTKALCACSF